MRYAMMWRWRRDLTPPVPEPDYDPDSYGAILRHRERWQAIERKISGRADRSRKERRR